METNPYQAPKSDIETDRTFKRSVWWKVYFIIVTMIGAYGNYTYLDDSKAGFVDYVSLFLWLVATAGLFGFVFNKAIYRSNFWLYALAVYLLFSFVYYFITDLDLRMGMGDAEFYISVAIGVFLSLPTYYALYIFSKPDNPVWKKA
jgi:hypothetical protein